MPQSMHFSIYPRSPELIYAQLMGQVRRLIAAGQLKPGDKLPSVREIATTLTINPMTVSKAFSLLEAEKVMKRVRGVAMMVADSHAGEKPMDQRLQMLKAHARKGS